MEQPRKKNNTTRNILIGLGVVLALCLCAGIIGTLVAREAGKRVADTIETDPAAAAAAGRQIAEYDLPAGYSEQVSMGLFGYNFVIIGRSSDFSDGVMIMLAQFEQIAAGQADPETFKQQMQQSLEQQSGRRGINMQVVETREMTIRGGQVTVIISEGTDENGISIRQAIAVFPGKSGMAMVMIQGLKSEWDDALVDDFLESIR